jgi:HAD superfamily hydrolase (TIGR01509 family)
MPAKRALLVDALGTLVELEPPWVRLRASLDDELPAERVEAAMRAEMRYYRGHSHEGRDAASLADLRARCAAVLSRELGRDVGADVLMAAIRFTPYPDAAPALDAARDRGLTTVCVSNWDAALPDVLERCGLLGRLDAVVASATAGARKPDPAIFAAALELAGCGPADAVHVGDTPEEDVAGARAAGIDALLLDRDSAWVSAAADPAEPDAKRRLRPEMVIASLDQIDQYLGP